MKIIALLSMVVTLLVSTFVIAQDKEGPHDAAITARQALMQVYKFDWAILGNMAKEKTEYDSEAAIIAANNLLTALKIKQTYMWPEGSDSENPANKKNLSLPSIWTTYPDIQEADKKMLDAAIEMNDQAGNGLDALKTAMKGINNGCKGCHDDYREKTD